MTLRPLLLAALFLFSACAAESPDATDTSVGRDVGSDADADDGSSEDAEADDGSQPDVSDDASDGSSPGDADDGGGGTDLGGDVIDCEVVGEECVARSVYCADLETRAFCSRCGFILSSEPCDEGEVCDASSGVAECRPCVDAECPEIVDCEPRERSCLNWQTVQVCGADGTVETTQPCPAGRRCFNGSCGPEGGETGVDCTADIDPTTGCKGSLCVCGPGWTAENGSAACSGALAGGYCSTGNCAVNGCNYADEVCFDAAGNPLGGESFCVLRNGCTLRGRACGTGMVCEELPGRRGPSSDITWELACFTANTAGIGGACTNDADCVGGECRTRNVGGADVSYCTSACGAGGGCPSYAACVEDPNLTGDYICLAKADGGECPRLSTEPFWIQDRTVDRFGGGNARVCYFPRASD